MGHTSRLRVSDNCRDCPLGGCEEWQMAVAVDETQRDGAGARATGTDDYMV